MRTGPGSLQAGMRNAAALSGHSYPCENSDTNVARQRILSKRTVLSYLCRKYLASSVFSLYGSEGIHLSGLGLFELRGSLSVAYLTAPRPMEVLLDLRKRCV